MFGGREREALQEQIDELRADVERLRSEDAMAQRLLDDATLVETLGEEASRVSAAAEATLAQLRDATASSGMHQPRFTPEWNEVYCAEVGGLVVAWMDSGRTDKISLLVGPDNPPNELVCYGNSRNDINPFLCGLVRPGEHWMLESAVGSGSGWKAVFTPSV